MSWIAEHWLGVLTLIAAAVGAVASVRHLRLARRDVEIRIAFPPEEGEVPKVWAVLETKIGEPVELNLVALNLGGTTSEPGRVVITVPPNLDVAESVHWSEDTPNARMPSGSSAWSCLLSPLDRNETGEIPTLQVKPRSVDGVGDLKYRLRWEVWTGQRGANADDLSLTLRSTKS